MLKLRPGSAIMARMYRALSSLRFACVALLGAAAALAGCSAGAPGADGGSGANAGTGSSGNGNGNGSGTGGGISLDGGDGGTTGGPGSGRYCQEGEIIFEPQTPTVFVLVDRSGTMFEENRWTNLRDAVLPVIEALQADVRFGIGAYNSVNAGGTCPASVIEDQGTIDLNHYAAIQSFYTGLSTTPPAGKLDTPTSVAVAEAAEILRADPSPGAKAILLVTSDDDPDFCDDVGPNCGNDAAIGAMQAAYALGIQTFVFGLDNPGIQYREWFDFWAQAGAGQQPNWTEGLTKNQYSGQIYNACQNNVNGWLPAWTEAGRTAFDPIGLYSAEGGTATAFVSADTSLVAEEIRSKVEGLKSCIIDLPNVEVKAGYERSADVFVNEVQIPDEEWELTATNPAVIAIKGAACETWKDPAVTKFFAGFECEAITIK